MDAARTSRILHTSCELIPRLEGVFGFETPIKPHAEVESDDPSGQHLLSHVVRNDIYY